MIVGVYISSCISGSKAADMATVGLPMNRKLEEHGYLPEERAAILAASAAMAESVPPSIALILLGSATAISTGALFIAGVLPAAVIAAMLMVTVRVRATTANWRPTPRAPRSEIVRTGRRALLPLMIPVILIGGIVGGIGTPTEVSTFAVLYSLVLGLGYRKITAANLWSSLTSASVLNGMIFYTVSAATIFSWALTLEGVTTAIATTIAGLGQTAFLPAVILITILMGDDARELRHHRHPGAAAAAGGAAARHRPAAIRDHHEPRRSASASSCRRSASRSTSHARSAARRSRRRASRCSGTCR